MRVFKWIAAILLGLILVIVVGVYDYLRWTLPDYTGKINVPGLMQPVEIIRDAYGMPHIYAQTDADVYFALGFCMAQDRLFHMDLTRRAARGKLAEILGKDLVSVDRFFRTITAGKSVEGIAAAYTPETRHASQAYADGVNYYASLHPREVKRGVVPVTGKDIVAGFVFKLPFFYQTDHVKFIF